LEKVGQRAVRVGDRRVRRFERDDVVVGAVLGRQLRADGFDRLAGLEDGGQPDLAAADEQAQRAGDRFVAGPLDERAARPTGANADEALDLEDAQGLANRRAAHSGLHHQLAFGRQRGAFGELTAQDSLAQLVDEHVGRFGNVERAQLDGRSCRPIRPRFGHGKPSGQWSKYTTYTMVHQYDAPSAVHASRSARPEGLCDALATDRGAALVPGRVARVAGQALLVRGGAGLAGQR